MDGDSIKAERANGHGDTPMADTKPSYKSWKKKYRKMRLHFDRRMQESEDLHRQEEKALRVAKRLAVENDRLLEVLSDINQMPQIPLERRIDISLEDELTDDEADAPQKPKKSLKRLLKDVPHMDFDTTIEHHPEVLEEIQPKDPELYPTSFLTADDIDKYTAELDMQLGFKTKPTISSEKANGAPNSSAANYALRNPTSVYNWLRKHAPKTFLQDLEKEKDKEKEKDRGDEKAEGTSRRKSAGTRGSKRQSTASRKEVAEPMDWDDDSLDIPPTSAKGKRKRDDDPGYRPKGGSSRPAKKKRQSKDLSSARKSKASKD